MCVSENYNFSSIACHRFFKGITAAKIVESRKHRSIVAIEEKVSSRLPAS